MHLNTTKLRELIHMTCYESCKLYCIKIFKNNNTKILAISMMYLFWYIHMYMPISSITKVIIHVDANLTILKKAMPFEHIGNIITTQCVKQDTQTKHI